MADPMPWDPVDEDTTDTSTKMPWDEDETGGGTEDQLLPTIDVGLNMYDNFETDEQGTAFEKASKYYQNLITRNPDGSFVNPDVSVVNDSPSLMESSKVYIYTDPNTGDRNVINPPSRSAFGNMFGFAGDDDPTVSFGRKVVGGIAESAGDAAEFGAAVLDKTAENIGIRRGVPIDTNFTEKVQQNTFGLKTDDLGDSLIVDGLPALMTALVPGVGVYRGLQGVTNALKNAPKVIQLFGNLVRAAPAAITGEFFATTTVGTEDDTLLFGEGKVFGDIGNLTNLGEDEAARVINQRMNVFVEGMSLGGVLGTGFKIGKDVTTLGYDVLLSAYAATIGNNTKKQVYLRLSEELANLGPDATPEQLARAREVVADIVRENKDVIVEDINNLGQNKTLTLDTVSALIKGNVDQTDAANAQRIRAGQINAPGGEQVKAQLDAPVNEVTNQLETQAQNLIGDSTNQQVLADSAEGLVNVARTQVDDIVQKNAEEVRQAYAQSVDEVVDAISDDLGLLKRLEEASGTKIVDDKTAARVQIQEGLEQNYSFMVNQKNARYAEIQGGEVDVDAIYDLFSRMPGEEVTRASTAFSRNDNFLAQLQPQRVSEEIDGKTVTRLETPDEIKERFGAWIESSGADFGFFYRKVRPEFAQLASAAFDDNNPLLGSYYRKILNFIDEDMVDFVEESSPELAEAAIEAKRYYKDEFAIIWRDDDKMQQFANIWDSTLGRTPANEQSSIVTGTERFRPGYTPKVEDLTRGILEGGNTARIKNLATAIDGAADPGAIADYMIVDTVNNFYNAIKSSGLEQADLSNFTTSLRQYAEQLNTLAETSPQMADKINSLNTFIARVEDASRSQNAVNDIEKILAGVNEASKDMLGEVENSVLKNFFNTERTPRLAKLLGGDSSKIMTTTNPQAQFEKVFGAGQRMGGESRQRVAELMDIISEQPPGEQVVLMKGLKLAYNNFLRDGKVLAKTPELGGVTPLKSAAIGDMLINRDSALDLGRIIYRDQPSVVNAIETILQAGKEATDSARATPIRSQSATGFNVAARSASTRLIYLTVGPLNRLGARLRALSNVGVDRMDADTRANAVLNEILANADEYVALADKYNKNPRDPLLQDLMVGFIARAFIKTEIDGDGSPLESVVEETEEILNTVAQ
tara:strand:- start:4925 stop:8374 length:3450 start_codon:yes stop_codon:yes gene_type:complete